jgi:hypothetical protein
MKKKLNNFFAGIFPRTGLFAAVILACMVSCRNSDDFSENDDAFTRTENLSAELQTDDENSAEESEIAEISENSAEESEVAEISENSAEENFADESSEENSGRAKFVITEVRNSNKTDNGKHKSEFVEIYVLKGGNLSGFEILSANDGEETKFTLPSVEVEKRETVVLHMRNLISEGGAESELGDNLTLSTHVDSSDARDLWAESNTNAVFAKSDIVYILDTESKEIVDAVLFAKSAESGWAKKIAEIAEKISEDVWQGGTSITNAVCSDNITDDATGRSLSRTNLSDVISAYEKNETIPNSKENWTVGSTSIGTN